jgi:hypothetical protein
LSFVNDSQFYLRVIELEEPGQLGNEFKMHIFKSTPESPNFDQQFELTLASMISDVGGEGVQIGMMSEDKLRAVFWVKDK